MTERNDTVETKDMSDRALLLRMYHLQVEQNGNVARLIGDMYGDPLHSIFGIKPLIQKHERWISRSSTILTAIGVVAGSLGVVEVTRLIQWLVAGTP